MLVIAHAGHWLAQLAYAAPLVFLIVAVAYGKWKARRAGRAAPGPEHQ